MNGHDIIVRFHLNGDERTVSTPPDATLINLLREHFALTAAKTACGIGRCGACLVLMNGQAVNSCLVMAWQLEGADIVSPEALDAFPQGRIVRDALVAEVAFQCGYCAPGFTVALTALFKDRPDASDSEIRTALEGNLCRCTGYFSILRGAIAARRLLAEASSPPINERLRPSEAVETVLSAALENVVPETLLKQNHNVPSS